MREHSARISFALGLVLTAATAIAAPVERLGAQAAVRPELEWRTISTRHFDIHFPAQAERWTREIAERLDAVRDSVAGVVGYAPDVRVTVMVEDPANSSNGFAIPFLRGPVIMLWPTPVAAPHVLAHNRGWGDVLAVHEYAHLAHLTRPSRNSTQRLLWSLLPVELGPVTRRAPRWVFEGYATWVEGWLTGSGRPNGAWRASILRQLAMEGRLPTYAQLNGSEQFQGGAMAYLAGSAFLEWLDAREQERLTAQGVPPGARAADIAAPGQSLVRLWRRMSARADRSFNDAFAGTFGEAPAAAHARFSAELTASAIAIRDSLARSGNGIPVQRLTYGTGEPAVSPDGTRLALVRRRQDGPPILQVIRIDPGADTAAERRQDEARERLLERDPEDVPAIRIDPLHREPVASLEAVEGRAADRPRFMPDGRSILFSRLEPYGNGAYRSDLSVWDWEDGGERRITHGSGIREADPTPDGKSAVGVSCVWGICDLVRVDLGSGTVSRLLAGEPDVQYAGPRVARDGTIAVAEQRDGRWSILLLNDSGSVRRMPTSDAASRYAPAFTPDGSALIVTSERGGIPHLERIDMATGASVAIARSTGASFAADVATDGRVFFLSLHAGGHDLRQTSASTRLTSAEFGPMLGQAFGAASSRYVPAVAPVFGSSVQFDRASVEPEPYRARPGMPVIFPGGGYDADGGYFSLALAASDPVGKLGLVLEGGTGDRSSWRGGGLSAAWRGWPVHVSGNLSIARNEPSLHSEAATSATALDAELRSATLGFSASRVHGLDVVRLNLGASAGQLELLRSGSDMSRMLVFADARLTNVMMRDRRFFAQRVSLSGASGRTGGDTWARSTAGAQLEAGVGRLGAGVSVVAGMAGNDTPVWEQFAVGGAPVAFASPQAWSQRIALSGLPAGTLTGDRLLLWRAEARLGLPVGLRPFITSVSTDRGFHHWQRIAGMDVTATFSRIPYLRLPNVVLHAGWARTLTNPHKGRDSFTGGVRFSP